MTTLAPATTGFLPVHVYEGPELERARDICASINAFAFEAMGLGKADVTKVRDLTLRQMLDAVEAVERWNDRPKIDGVSYSVSMVPAERLVAAVYTLVNHRNRSACGSKDDDQLLVRFTEKRWGDEFVHFLLVGDREKTEVESEDDEA